MLFHRVAGVAGAGWMSGLSAFAVGAMAAGAVLSMIRQRELGIPGIRNRESVDDSTLEELITEKEHLEDLIAEKAAKEAG